MTVFPFEFFTSAGVLAASIHRSVDNLVDSQPAVVITGSWLTVKEQMADRYAAELAALGYTVITFDFTGFGRSSGEPRQAELPAKKIADITEVARQVASLSFVDAGGVGYLAVCASAQYALRAIAEGAPVAAFASVAGWYHHTATVAPFYGGEDGVATRLERAADAIEAFRNTGEVRTVPAYEQDNDKAAMFLPLPYYGSADRGAIPAWRNEMAEFSWLYWLTFDGLRAGSEVTVPTLFVHSDDCVLPDNVKALAQTIPGAELVWGKGSQIDFYDQEAQVSFAVEAADRHFRRHLSAAQ